AGIAACLVLLLFRPEGVVGPEREMASAKAGIEANPAHRDRAELDALRLPSLERVDATNVRVAVEGAERPARTKLTAAAPPALRVLGGGTGGGRQLAQLEQAAGRQAAARDNPSAQGFRRGTLQMRMAQEAEQKSAKGTGAAAGFGGGPAAVRPIAANAPKEKE